MSKENKELLQLLQDPDQEKIIRQTSKFYWVAFQSLKVEGFSSTEAIELLKARGAFLI